MIETKAGGNTAPTNERSLGQSDQPCAAKKEYQKRDQRFWDALALNKPDQIPIMPMLDFFPARRMNLNVEEVMYSPELMISTWMKYLDDYQPDRAENPFPLRGFARLLGVLDFQHLKWAGHGLPSHMSYQFVEMELMKADEYDHFINDMSDFMVRKYMPRVHKGLAGLAKLPPLNQQISYFWGLYNFAVFGDPEVQSALEVLKEASAEAKTVLGYAAKFSQMATDKGYPPVSGGYTQVPLDTLGDVFRGTREIMMDFRRRPEKIMAACEKLLPLMLEMGINSCRRSGVPICFIPLHKCMDSFISPEQFQKFYWPHMKQLLEGLIAAGITPWVLVEGVCDQRMETFAQVPPGKVLYHLEGSDIFRAKKIMREVACLRGNMPPSIMSAGTPDDVRGYVKKLIDVVGEGGGFMMDCATSITDAREENVRALYEYTREHGRY